MSIDRFGQEESQRLNEVNELSVLRQARWKRLILGEILIVYLMLTLQMKAMSLEQWRPMRLIWLQS